MIADGRRIFEALGETKITITAGWDSYVFQILRNITLYIGACGFLTCPRCIWARKGESFFAMMVHNIYLYLKYVYMCIYISYILYMCVFVVILDFTLRTELFVFKNISSYNAWAGAMGKEGSRKKAESCKTFRQHF